MATLEELEERIAKRDAERREQYDAQRLLDLEKKLELEAGELGPSGIVTTVIDIAAYTPGLPTLVCTRVPKGAEFKRFQDTINNAETEHQKLVALNQVAAVGRIYPDGDVYKQLLDAMPGIHVRCGNAVLKRVQGKEDDRGKG
jgi:hypothetical protein